ncbi:MAG: ABC transporter ATP-binding protein [Candidatus Thorarchaeota archaeon]|jgi:ABC-type multidrug transport system ATPase subunit
MTSIQVDGLTRRYGYRVALKNISFEVPVGGVHALFGSNGAGKTTLMRIISTLLQPHAGKVSVFGFDAEEDPIEVRRRIGVVGDKPLLYGELTGRENLKFYSDLYDLDSAAANSNIEELAEQFDVKLWLDEPTKILSTGLRKRFDIIRSLLHNPDLFLLDEPFSGLDKDSTQVFKNYIEEKRQERTAIVTTHNLTLGSELCDDFITLRKGEIVGQGPISEFDGNI